MRLLPRRRLGRLSLLPVASALVLSLVVPGVAAATGPETAATTTTPGPARLAFNGSRAEPVVALTFDDGASAGNTRRIFEILRVEGVPATFFPYAYKVRANPALWREIAQAGYPIAHHSLSHSDLTKVSEPRLYYEIRFAQQVIEGITGRPMLRVLRPPYGARDERLARVAGELGYPTLLLWDTESRDTSRRASSSTIYKRAIAGRNGSVVLLHAGPDVTPTILREIIASYRARGFRFVTVAELLGPKRAPWPGVTTAASTDGEAGGSTAVGTPVPAAPRPGDPPVPVVADPRPARLLPALGPLAT
jgi:peptidoglycan/xylan/chitin deacetylase (PgdA/CDA1 family)